MPQIKEYTQQVSTPSGISDFSVNPSIEGAAGRGLQQAGAAISNVGDMLLDVQQAKEKSSAAASFAEKSFARKKQLIEDTNKGIVNEKYLEDFNNQLDSDVQEITNGFITRGASEYGQKYGLEYKQSFREDAFKSLVETSKVQFVNNSAKMLSSFEQQLMLDPTKFDALANTYANSMSESAGGLVDRKVVSGAVSEGIENLKVAEFRGLIRTKKTVSELNNLYESLRGGDFSERSYDSGTQKKLESEIITEINRINSVQSYSEKLNKKAKESSYNATSFNLMKKIINGDASFIQDMQNEKVVNALGPDGLKQVLSFAGSNPMKKVNKPLQESNYLKAANDLRDGKKVDLLSYSEEELSTQQRFQLMRIQQGLDSPEGKARAKAEKIFLDGIKSELTGRDRMTGNLRDPDGPAKYIQFEQEYLDKKQQMIDAGEAPEKLLDLNAKEYFGVEYKKYKSTAKEIRQKRKLPTQRPVGTDGKPKSINDILKEAGSNKDNK